MKKLILLLVVPLLAVALAVPAAAEEADLSGYFDLVDVEAVTERLPEHTRRRLEELELARPDPGVLLQQTPGKVFGSVLEEVRHNIREPVQAVGKALGAVILAAFLETLREVSGASAGMGKVFSLTAVLAAGVAFAGPLAHCIQMTSRVLCDCADFMLGFLPVFTGVLTACGQPATASVCNLFLFWMCQLVSRFAADMLIPALGFYLALSLIAGVSPELPLSGLASAAKTVLTWVMGLMMTLFVGLLTMSSVVSAGGDALSVKTAKFMLGSFVPVVGGALSDAFATAQGCLHFVKATLGIYGIWAAAILFLPVLVRLAVWYLAANLCSAAGEILNLKKISGMMRCSASALGILLALTLCFLLVLMVSVTVILIVSRGG